MNQHLILRDQKNLENDRQSSVGTPPFERSVQELISTGFIILDKPVGPTSHDVVATVKKILDVSKAGHLGTLDPQVSGVLPIALDRATKVLSALQNAEKEYVCNLKFQEPYDSEKFKVTLKEFEGQIYQVPPLKSNVAKKLRTREIKRILLLEELETEALMTVLCQAGTYIRTLCIDIGRAMGVPAHMKELRRTQAGSFHEDQTVTLHNLYDAIVDYQDFGNDVKIRQVIQPIETVLEELPKIIIKNSAVDAVCHGNPLLLQGVLAFTPFKSQQLVGIFTAKEELIGIATTQVKSDMIEGLEVGIVAKPSKIVMKRGSYPRYSN